MWDHIKLADIYCRLSDEEKKHGNESESISICTVISPRET